MNTQHMKLKWRTPSTMNTNHTSLYDGEDASGYTKPLFDIVSKGHEEKARRIAACVNACAGVDNETLRKIADKEMDGSEIVELAKVKQQCDELLEVLDKLARLGNEPLFGNSIGNKIALDAILKAQGYKT